MSVNVTLTPTAYFSPIATASEYTVTNDFNIVIDKTADNSDEVGGGLDYPTVLISGLDVLYVDPLATVKDYGNFVRYFLNLFTSDTYGWNPSADSTVSPPRLKLLYTKNPKDESTQGPTYPVRFTLSSKVAFPRVLDDECSCDITVNVEQKSGKSQYTLPLSLKFAPYVCQFGAYVTGKDDPITALYHGEKCNLSWTVKGDQKADVLVRIGDHVTNSQNPCELTVTKDTYCSFLLQSESVNMEYGFTVYRSLWKDTGDAASGLPAPDNIGSTKIFLNNGKYYVYIHPVLYCSDDYITWTTCSENNAFPSDFSSYTVSMNEKLFGVCFKKDKTLTYSLYEWGGGWKKYDIKNTNRADYVVPVFSKPYQTEYPADMYILVFSQNGVKLSEIDDNGHMINDQFYDLPDEVKIISADITDEEEGLVIAALCESTDPTQESKQIFYIDWNDPTKNNIFPDIPKEAETVTIGSAGKHYIFAGGTVNCVENDNMSDLHNFPPSESGFTVGEYDSWSLRLIAVSDEKFHVWKYGL
jgi:hypothetical protein